MRSHNKEQQAETPQSTAHEQTATRPVAETEDDDGGADGEANDLDTSDAPMPVRCEIHVVDRPNAKLSRQHQAEARREALRSIRANPINGDPIVRSLRY